ncbi:hypothetical protein HDU85_005878 [Gaertneriomyces sp. JEL0708]|nr:hypothetical protein HDU85_005878 [Gaertneriomyces sp. JEL0708]
MKRAQRHRISYVLKDDYAENRHHVGGVNALAFDDISDGGILYTAGRDSTVNAWSTHIDQSYHAYLSASRDRRMRHHNLNTRQTGKPKPPRITELYAHTPQRASFDYLTSLNSLTLQTTTSVADDDSITTSPVDATAPENELSSSPPADGHTKEDGLLRKTRSVTFSGVMAGYNAPRLQHPVQKSTSSLEIGIGSVTADTKKPDYSQKHVPKPTTLLRSYNHHNDWVNDIKLCNANQHVLTCSNDRTIYLAPTTQPGPAMPVGHHLDYVKCLAHSQHREYVASAGLDGVLLIWDLRQGNGVPMERIPVGTVEDGVEAEGDEEKRTSVYALACNPAGNVLASGSPDKIVRIWDYNSSKPVVRLTGHSEPIRSLLLSHDGRWVLSASSDATIKLWSLAMPHRPMVTYTHYENSVFSLYSHHPDLDTFWAGGRDGWVTKISRRRMTGVTEDVGVRRSVDDELVDCVAVCKEDGPVLSIVAKPDLYVWTCTSEYGGVKRWRDVPFHQVHLGKSSMSAPGTDWDENPVTIPTASIIRSPQGAVHLDDAASLRSYRPFSVFSTDAFSKSGMSLLPLTDAVEDLDPVEPAFAAPVSTLPTLSRITKYTLLNNRRHLLTQSSNDEVCLWDIIRCTKVKSFGNLSWENVLEVVQTKEWVANWCGVEIGEGGLRIALEESKVAEAEAYWNDLEEGSKFGIAEEPRVNLGRWMLTSLFEHFLRHHYQPHNPQSPFNADNAGGLAVQTPVVGLAPEAASTNVAQSGADQEGYFTMNSHENADNSSSVPAGSTGTEIVGMGGSSSSDELRKGNVKESTQADDASISSSNTPSMTAPGPKEAATPLDSKDTSEGSVASTAPSTPGSLMDRLKSHVRKRTNSANRVELLSARDNDGKEGKDAGRDKDGDKAPQPPVRRDSMSAGPLPQILEKETPPPVPTMPTKMDTSATPAPQPQPVPNPINPQLSQPALHSLPPLTLPSLLPISLSVEESPSAAHYLPLWKGNLASQCYAGDVQRLEEVLPTWVYDVVEGRCVPNVSKIGFGLVPWMPAEMREKLEAKKDKGKSKDKDKDKDNGYKPLDELPNGNPRLSASPTLRLLKLSEYVVQKLNLDAGTEIELLYNDEVLSPKTTLANVKHFVWKGGDGSMYYRKRQHTL